MANDIAVIVPEHYYIDARILQKLKDCGIHITYDSPKEMARLQGRSFVDVRVTNPKLMDTTIYNFLKRPGARASWRAEH